MSTITCMWNNPEINIDIDWLIGGGGVGGGGVEGKQEWQGGDGERWRVASCRLSSPPTETPIKKSPPGPDPILLTPLLRATPLPNAFLWHCTPLFSSPKQIKINTIDNQKSKWQPFGPSWLCPMRPLAVWPTEKSRIPEILFLKICKALKNLFWR